jgi:hypothetical protein
LVTGKLPPLGGSADASNQYLTAVVRVASRAERYDYVPL